MKNRVIITLILVNAGFNLEASALTRQSGQAATRTAAALRAAQRSAAPTLRRQTSSLAPTKSALALPMPKASYAKPRIPTTLSPNIQQRLSQFGTQVKNVTRQQFQKQMAKVDQHLQRIKDIKDQIQMTAESDTAKRILLSTMGSILLNSFLMAQEMYNQLPLEERLQQDTDNLLSLLDTMKKIARSEYDAQTQEISQTIDFITKRQNDPTLRVSRKQYEQELKELKLDLGRAYEAYQNKLQKLYQAVNTNYERLILEKELELVRKPDELIEEFFRPYETF